MMILKTIFSNICRLFRRHNDYTFAAMQLGPRRSYLLKDDGEIVTIDSCICITEQDNAHNITVSNRGFFRPIAKRVIWPIIDNSTIADYKGLEILTYGLLSRCKSNKRINLYATIQPDITDVEIQSINDSIRFSRANISLSLISKPIAIAVGAGLELDRSESIYIVDVYCDCRAPKESHYGIWMSEFANGRMVYSKHFYFWEDNVVCGILSKTNSNSPRLFIVGDCDDIYRFCRLFNENGAQAIVPQNPDCIALQGIIRMLTEKMCLDIDDAMIN